MQYETSSSNLPNLKYGREMEERGWENYYALVGPYHLPSRKMVYTSVPINLTWVPPQMKL